MGIGNSGNITAIAYVITMGLTSLHNPCDWSWCGLCSSLYVIPAEDVANAEPRIRHTSNDECWRGWTQEWTWNWLEHGLYLLREVENWHSGSMLIFAEGKPGIRLRIGFGIK